MSEYTRNNYHIKRNKNKIIDLFQSIFTLKNTIRTGWVKYHSMKEEKSESVADHVFSVAVLGYSFAREYRKDLNADRVLKILLFHEFGEVYAGDIALRDFADPQEKKKKEKKSIEQVFSELLIKDDVMETWNEFENQKTPEAKFCMQFDKLEAVLQAHLYHNNVEKKVDFKSFIKYSEKSFFDKEIIELIENLKKS